MATRPSDSTASKLKSSKPRPCSACKAARAASPERLTTPPHTPSGEDEPDNDEAEEDASSAPPEDAAASLPRPRGLREGARTAPAAPVAPGARAPPPPAPPRPAPTPCAMASCPPAGRAYPLWRTSLRDLPGGRHGSCPPAHEPRLPMSHPPHLGPGGQGGDWGGGGGGGGGASSSTLISS